MPPLRLLFPCVAVRLARHLKCYRRQRRRRMGQEAMAPEGGVLRAGLVAGTGGGGGNRNVVHLCCQGI